MSAPRAHELAALWSEVVAFPDDDAPRRVLADALLERGDPHGELIHVQCERDRHPDDSDLRDRALELMDEQRDRWVSTLEPAIAPFIGEVLWQRGFVDVLGLETSDAPNPGRRAPRLAPAALGRLLRDPQLRLVRWLHISAYRQDEAYGAQLAAQLACNDPDCAPSLRELSLSSMRLAPDGVARLFAAGRPWQRLASRNAGLEDAAAEAIAARAPASLVTLELADNRLGPGAAHAIARAPRLASLTRLSLQNNPLGPAGAAALVRGGLAAVRELALAECGLGAVGATELARARFDHLELLDLRSNDIGPEAFLALARAPFAAGLRELRVTDNNINDAAITALCAIPDAFPVLVRLALDGNPIGRRARARLFETFGGRIPVLEVDKRLHPEDDELGPPEDDELGLVVRRTR